MTVKQHNITFLRTTPQKQLFVKLEALPPKQLSKWKQRMGIGRGASEHQVQRLIAQLPDDECRRHLDAL